MEQNEAHLMSKDLSIFEKFSHLKVKSAPTQDKFLDFLQNEFSHSKCFQKAFFLLNGGQAEVRSGRVKTPGCSGRAGPGRAGLRFSSPGFLSQVKI